MSDPYKILDVDRNASLDEIKRAYRKKAAKYHPDIGGDAWVFDQVKRAYEKVLKERTQPIADEYGLAPEVTAGRRRTPSTHTTSTESQQRTTASNSQKNKKATIQILGILAGAVAAVIGSFFFLQWLNRPTDHVEQSSAEALHRDGATNVFGDDAGTVDSTNEFDNSLFDANARDQAQQMKQLNRELEQIDSRVSEIARQRSATAVPDPNRPLFGPVERSGRSDANADESKQAHKELPVTIPIGMPDSTVEAKELLEPLRDWTDPQTNSTFSARFIGAFSDKAQLKKQNGERIALSLRNLTPKDKITVATSIQPQLGARDLQIGNENSFTRIEKKLLLARDIWQFYDTQLKLGGLNNELEQYARLRMHELEQWVESNAVLVKDRFLTLKQIQQLRTESDAMIDEWQDLANSALNKEALAKINEAREHDPTSFRADFNLGLVYLFVYRDFVNADRHFDNAVQRGHDYYPILSPIDRVNLASALNNKALMKIRKNRLMEAKRAWIEMAQIVPSLSPESRENIQRVFKALEQSMRDSTRSYINVNTSGYNDFRDWHRSIVVNGGQVDKQAGWYYLPYMRSDVAFPMTYPIPTSPGVPSRTFQSSAWSNKRATVDRASVYGLPVGMGSGIVIKPGFILTSRNLVTSHGDPFDFYTIENEQMGRRMAAKLFTDSAYHNLAILCCDDPKIPGVPVRNHDIVPDEQLMIVGKPLSDFDEVRWAIEWGMAKPLILTSNREFNLKSHLNRGQIGSPVFDRRGNLAAVLTSPAETGVDKFGLARAVSGREIVEFINQYGFQFEPTTLETKTDGDTFYWHSDKVVRIDCWVNKQRLTNLSFTSISRQESTRLKGLEDSWCLVCNGSDELRCPSTKCINGKEKRFKLVNGTDSSGVFPATHRVEYWVKCPTCDGDNTVDCWGCTRGHKKF